MGKVVFNEENHTYINDKGIKLISVTQLLKKAEIAPDYSNIKEEVLTKAAEKGSLVHKEIELYCKENKGGFTTELENFIAYIQKNELIPIANEVIVSNDLVAGTIDCVLEDKEGKLILVDFKTTSSIHTECVSWQESIYKYLWDNQVNDKISKLQVFHFNSDGVLKVKDIPIKPTSKIVELFDWYKGETDKNPFEITLLNKEEIAIRDRAVAIIRDTKQKLEEAESQLDNIKQILIKAMKENGLTSYNDNVISISIVSGSTRKTVDTELLKTAFPSIYKTVLKETPTQETIRFKIKGE